MQYQQPQYIQIQPQQQYSGNKRPRKEINRSLVQGQPCPSCSSIINLTTANTGKQYLKCPNNSCGEWGAPPQIPQTFYPQNPQPQSGVATFTPPPPQPQYPSQPQQTNTNNSQPQTSGDQETLKAINVLSNRFNDLVQEVNSLASNLFLNDEDSGEKGAFRQLFDKIEDISSRLDQLQKDFGVSQESVKAHQSFIVAKKLPSKGKAEA